MKKQHLYNNGFTLIEIIVSIAILVLLMMTSFFYLRSNNTSVQVRTAASVLSDALRTAQTSAQSGVLVACGDGCMRVPSAFGVYIIQSDSSHGERPIAIMYADVDQGSVSADHRYTTQSDTTMEEAYPNLEIGTIVLDTLSLGGNSDVVIDSITGGDSSILVDIAFLTPTALMYIDGGVTNGRVTVTFSKGGITKDVIIDRVTGRIEPKF
ncbi:MAG: type II secretion system protein [bacterium]|nr:type II secretion system protein [bacterium]